MSKTLLTHVSTYLSKEESKRLDEIRGDIPRSRVVARAINRYLGELERNGKLQDSRIGTPTSQAAASNCTTVESDTEAVG